jgi:hypothetical protein
LSSDEEWSSERRIGEQAEANGVAKHLGSTPYPRNCSATTVVDFYRDMFVFKHSVALAALTLALSGSDFANYAPRLYSGPSIKSNDAANLTLFTSS